MYFFGLLESVAPLKEKSFANSPKFNFDVWMCTAYQLRSWVLSCLGSLESCYLWVSLGMSKYSVIWGWYHKNIINVILSSMFLFLLFFNHSTTRQLQNVSSHQGYISTYGILFFPAVTFDVWMTGSLQLVLRGWKNFTIKFWSSTFQKRNNKAKAY